MTTSASQSSKRKRKGPKFRVGEIAVIIGYPVNDPRALGYIRRIYVNGEIGLSTQLGEGTWNIRYTPDKLRPLTRRERGTHGG